MIDFGLEIKNIQPISIQSLELKQFGVNDNITKSIILYNQAIVEIKTMALDLAIKNLKKALSYNRSFAEAMKLLGLCYVNKEEYRRAEKIFKKLMKNERYCELAKEYIRNLLTDRTMCKTLESMNIIDTSIYNSNRKSILFKDLRRKIIIGVSILTIFITSYSISYWLTSIFQTDHNVVNSDAVTNEEHENIQKRLNDTKSELDTYKNKYDILITLDDVEKIYKAGNYEKASNTLLSIKDLNLDDETKTKFDKLMSDIRNNGLWSIYNQGNKLYKEGKYREALPKLKLVYEIGPSTEILPWITYQLGMCYKETNDKTNALLFFQRVKDNYPKSNYVSSSERMIKQIAN